MPTLVRGNGASGSRLSGDPLCLDTIGDFAADAVTQEEIGESGSDGHCQEELAGRRPAAEGGD